MKNDEKWNKRYLDLDTPWETGTHHPEIERLFGAYIEKGSNVLESGCGSGINASWLSSAGYKVTAFDISPEAIKRAKNRDSSVNFLVADILQDDKALPVCKVIFECAMLQVLTKEQRPVYVEKIASHCEDGGYWIAIVCSKDHAEEIEQKTNVAAPPYLTATKIIQLMEPYFELIEMKRCKFEVNRKESGAATFHAWGCVFKKRVW